MCEPSEKLIFCTCEDGNPTKERRTYLKTYYWVLTRYVGKKDIQMKGKIMATTSDLGQGISYQAAFEALSQGNPFDFDYQVQEKDALSVWYEGEPKAYFKMIFLNGKWKKGGLNPFTTKREEIATGRVAKRKSQVTLINYPPDILAKIHSTFEKEAPIVISALEDMLHQNETLRDKRIIRSIIFLTAGDINQLSTYIQAAKTDWRDILWWAEYDHNDGKNADQRLRDFEKPFEE